MNVVITGGGGFLGRQLADALLARGTLTGPSGGQQAIETLTLVDVAAAPPLPDPRVRQITGDIADHTFLEGSIPSETTSIFHLAAVVSGMAEAEFDVGMR